MISIRKWLLPVLAAGVLSLTACSGEDAPETPAKAPQASPAAPAAAPTSDAVPELTVMDWGQTLEIDGTMLTVQEPRYEGGKAYVDITAVNQTPEMLTSIGFLPAVNNRDVETSEDPGYDVKVGPSEVYKYTAVIPDVPDGADIYAETYVSYNNLGTYAVSVFWADK